MQALKSQFYFINFILTHGVGKYSPLKHQHDICGQFEFISVNFLAPVLCVARTRMGSCRARMC